MSPLRFRTACDVLRMLGPGRFALEIPPWVLRRQYVFYTVDPGDVPQTTGHDNGFALTLLSEEDLPAVVAVRPDTYTLAQLRARLRAGHLAFAVRRRDEIVSVRWIFVDSVYLPYLSRRLVLAPGEGFLDELYTMPRWRRKGAVTAAGQQIYGILHRRGFHRISCAIAAWNHLPQRLAEEIGYARVGRGGYWAVAGYRKYYWEGGLEERRRRDLVIHGPKESP